MTVLHRTGLSVRPVLKHVATGAAAPAPAVDDAGSTAAIARVMVIIMIPNRGRWRLLHTEGQEEQNQRRRRPFGLRLRCEKIFVRHETRANARWD